MIVVIFFFSVLFTFERRWKNKKQKDKSVVFNLKLKLEIIGVCNGEFLCCFALRRFCNNNLRFIE